MPTFGAPYIIGEFKTKKEFTTISKKISDELSGVSLDEFYSPLVVHPMFCKNDSFWNQADMIIKSGKAKIYADDEGGYKYCLNMGLVKTSRFRSDGCPHPYGEMFLVIKDKDLNKIVKKEELQTEEQYKKNYEDDGEDDEEDDE
jgi:hypothetical protein